MKKKDLLMLMAAAMLMPVGLASCASESVTSEVKNAPAGTRSVTFKISLPSGNPVHYTRAIQDGNEYKFNSLKLLVYDAKDETLLDVKDITASSGPSPSGNDYQYTYKEEMDDGTLARRFVFLANDDATDANLTKDTKAYPDLASAKAAVEVKAEAQSTTFADGYLPMTGEAVTNGSKIINMSQAADVQVSVEMTRAVARIDVLNNVPNLEITDLKLTHANPHGFLMQSGAIGSIAVPAGMTKVEGVELFSALSDAEGIETGTTAFIPDPTALDASGNVVTPAELKKAFYVYEDIDDAQDGVLTLLVQGKLSNTIGVYYQIPFIKGNVEGHTSDATDPEGIEIDRNHLYKVTIGDGTKVGINTKLFAKIIAADWDANTDVEGTFYSELFSGMTSSVTGVSYNKVTQHFELPVGEIADTDGVSIDVADTYWDGGAGVTIDQIQVITDGAWTAAATSATTGWLTAEITTNSDLTAADAQGKRVKISAAANATGNDRNGAVRIIYKNTSTGTADQRITFTFTQAGS